MSGLRQAVAFFAGVLCGVASLYVLLLWKGQLVRGPSLLAIAVAPATPIPTTPPPAATIPEFASPPPASAPAPFASAPSALEATTSPFATPSAPSAFVAPSAFSASSPQAEAHLAVPDVPTPPRDLPAPPAGLDDFARLKQRDLMFPVPGIDASRLRDNFSEMRGSHPHEAIDILAPRGTPVRAVGDGVVQKLFTSVQGGLTVYEFDREGEYCYYYAHLDRYADGLKEGGAVKKGDVIGYVGTTGNAPPGTPHLHFTIFKLGPEKQWWKGTAVNPFPLWALKVSNNG